MLWQKQDEALDEDDLEAQVNLRWLSCVNYKGYSFLRINFVRYLLFTSCIIQTTASGADALLRLTEYSQDRFCC
jgi:hypothetical protein